MSLVNKSKKQKREALLAAALELFAGQGLNRASTAQIAKRAGVASGTLFFHFNSKEELIHALFEQVRGRIEEALVSDVEAKMPVREQMIRLLSNLLRYFLAHPDEFRFMEQFHFSAYNTLNRELHSDKSYLHGLMLRAKEDKIIKDAPSLCLEALAFGPIVTLAKEYANCGTPIDKHTFETTVSASWDALKR
ncbi:MAG: TetR/AcrR family transcriptional regulator [Geobacteraceae bacterium]|nr:TetR/AcrR family transcriptional regulator [Geobacteraceae bacterium]